MPILLLALPLPLLPLLPLGRAAHAHVVEGLVEHVVEPGDLFRTGAREPRE